MERELTPPAAGDVRVRDTRDDDMAAITAIYAHWVETGTASFELEAPSQAEMRRRFAGYRESGFPWLTAERQGEVIGYAYAGAYRPRPAYRFTAEDSIYLHPGATGHGAGRLLLGALLDRLRADGFRSVIAVIGDPGVNRASVALHGAAGFAPFGVARRIGFKFERWLDVAYMQLEF
ncbi:GNAT family N-acetyltransferase [Minwuia thermotolerans]|uniref:GNAT family N-acetyltransferase n=1 Tax=Minwuia thermotolerans TaxID=2056226 RepID=A0A2M9G638_9PROT|nr:GNAT family N-acetyltransferase [Minwuia thermotolerans]PJK31178.1 GNAT family N-acetyltransferase [Minwuia thermotolerans]